MHKLLFVINPISGGLDKASFRQELKKFCNEVRVGYHIYETTGTSDEEELKRLISVYAPTRIFACGGDGTVNLVARCVYGAKIPVGIVPLGSANGLARELGIPLSIPEQLAQVSSEVVTSMDLLLVNNYHLCLHLCSVGLNATIIKRFDEGSIRGKAGYFLQLLNSIRNTQRHRYKFNIDGKIFRKSAESVIFANATKYGTGAVINPSGDMGDGKFEVCIIKPYPIHAIFTMTWLLFFGNLKKSRYVRIYPARNAVISSRHRVGLEIDGEIIGEFQKIKVDVIPAGLRVILPSNF